jgi:Rho-binding antiterminator
MNPYIPIDCHYYDELEALATLREEAVILYVADSGETLTVTSLIKDFFIVDKVEYMLLANGVEIRLDTIVSVNGKERPGACVV